MEKVLLALLQKEQNALAINPDEQHGLRNAQSTIHRLLRVIDYIAIGFSWKNSTGA